MKESFRYIKTIFQVAKTAFSNVEIEDYMQSANLYWEMLNSLDYESMLIESFTPNKEASKDCLMSFECEEVGKASIKKLKREAREMQEELENYYWNCLEAAKSIPQEEAIICNTAHSIVFGLWPKRLKELSDAYDLGIKVDCLKKKRTNGKPKGFKPIERPAFNTDDLRNGKYFNGVAWDFNANIIENDPFIKRSLKEGIKAKEIETALLQANPNAIWNGNRGDILYFLFKLYAKAYVRSSEKDYILKVQEEFLKIKQVNDFSKYTPGKEPDKNNKGKKINVKKAILDNIWYEIKDDNNKIIECGFKCENTE